MAAELPPWLGAGAAAGAADALGEPTDSAQPLDPRWAAFQRNLASLTAELPPADDAGLVSVDFDPTDPSVVERCLAALHRDGAVILSRAVAPELCDALYADLGPYIEANKLHLGGFDSSVESRRFDGINARSPHAHPIVAHPVLLQLCQAVLGQQALDQSPAQLLDLVRPDPRQPFELLPWALHLVELIQVGPGKPDAPTAAQGVHDDGGYCGYGFRKLFGITHTISTIWALSEFTEECGATRVIRGSHRWPPGRRPSGEETCGAAMPKGSVVIYLSSTIHGSGANQTEEPRIGLNVDYNLAQIRGEETQLLSNPPEVARDYSRHMQKLVRFTRPGPNLGAHWGDFAHPATALMPQERRLDWARGHEDTTWQGHTGRNAMLAGAVMSGSNNGLSLMSEYNKEHPEAAAAERFSAPESERWMTFLEDLNHWTQALPPLSASSPIVVSAASAAATAEPPVVAGAGAAADCTAPGSAGTGTVPEQLLAALCRDGAVVYENAISAQACSAIVSEMQSYLQENLASGNGRRAGAVLARSRSSWDMLTHPDVMAVCEAAIGHQVLMGGPNWIGHQLGSIRAENEKVETMRWQLNVAHLHGDNTPAATAAGATAEVEAEGGVVGACSGLRRSHDYLQMDLGNKLTVQVNVVWALEDITVEQAPQVVCGSHREPKHAMLAMPKSTAVPMRAGSCLLYTGNTFAALRPEQSDDSPPLASEWPLILRSGYAPSVFFEEELQLLSNPPEIARHYPIPLQRLVGYDIYGGSFGYWGDRQVRKRGFCPLFRQETMILSRQARDKHRESTHKRLVFYVQQHPIEAFNLESIRWADHVDMGSGDSMAMEALPEHYQRLAAEETPSFKKVLFQGSTVRPAAATEAATAGGSGSTARL
jgi:ectoine hydroxylase-related dioxygenase (phytanoyl-CoA dioxygenase family)